MTDNNMKGEEIPYKMLSQDAYSQWLGIEILECEIGRCKVAMTITKEMLNSMNKAHGGISYSLADTALDLQQTHMVNLQCLSKRVLII
jgi:acyl-CoA thioesterase